MWQRSQMCVGIASIQKFNIIRIMDFHWINQLKMLNYIFTVICICIAFRGIESYYYVKAGSAIKVISTRTSLQNIVAVSAIDLIVTISRGNKVVIKSTR